MGQDSVDSVNIKGTKKDVYYRNPSNKYGYSPKAPSKKEKNSQGQSLSNQQSVQDLRMNGRDVEVTPLNIVGVNQERKKG